jgi:hypothetical protein
MKNFSKLLIFAFVGYLVFMRSPLFSGNAQGGCRRQCEGNERPRLAIYPIRSSRRLYAVLFAEHLANW